MPKKHDGDWKVLLRVKYLSAEQSGGRKSAAEIEREFALIGAADYPKERTIRDWMIEADGLTEGEKRQYLYVRWPDSFDAGALPWEAAPAVLELLSPLLAEGETEHRPTVAGALIWWHVAQSAPHLSFEERQVIARILFRRRHGWVDDDDLAQRDAERLILGLAPVGQWRTADPSGDSTFDQWGIADLPKGVTLRQALFIKANTGDPGTAMRRDLDGMNRGWAQQRERANRQYPGMTMIEVEEIEDREAALKKGKKATGGTVKGAGND